MTGCPGRVTERQRQTNSKTRVERDQRRPTQQETETGEIRQRQGKTVNRRGAETGEKTDTGQRD